LIGASTWFIAARGASDGFLGEGSSRDSRSDEPGGVGAVTTDIALEGTEGVERSAIELAATSHPLQQDVRTQAVESAPSTQPSAVPRYVLKRPRGVPARSPSAAPPAAPSVDAVDSASRVVEPPAPASTTRLGAPVKRDPFSGLPVEDERQ
jgi:hypothetical protein